MTSIDIVSDVKPIDIVEIDVDIISSSDIEGIVDIQLVTLLIDYSLMLGHLLFDYWPIIDDRIIDSIIDIDIVNC